MQSPSPHPLEVWLPCPGVGHVRRGYESTVEELFAALSASGRHRATLFKGAGPCGEKVHRLPCVLRSSPLAARVARWLPRLHPYALEQITFGLSLVAQLVEHQPDAVMVCDPVLARLLYRARFLYRRTALVFCNGAPCPPPFPFADLVQHVSPVQCDEALAAGEPPDKHRFLPHALRLEHLRPDPTGERRRRARQWLGIAPDARVVVSVGHVSFLHKRMDYVLREVAAAAVPGTMVVLAGQETEETPAIARLAAELFPDRRHRIVSVPAEQVGDVYAAADAFALGSLTEGFGRVVAEALAAGLPVLLHDTPVLRFVAGEDGRFGAFTQPGALAALVRAELTRPADPAAARARSETVARRFSWEVLQPGHEALFTDAVAARRATHH